ncbi:hypothetical protein, unknown function [Leishmania tarentolae]|uniref:Uncharacterized protein n=1 Tax=Leishmania tarentolae TaxID=5689 RepID=A0A640KB15_LEITA|nr:hypothetical protein, unknown function [Leishmania tarentolae]
MVLGKAPLTLLRGSVVVSAVAAALCLGATMLLPLFRLDIDALNSSITQSLWTTDVYTPAGEKHIPVTTFVKDCSDLVTAFQMAQVSTVVGIGALAVAFLCAVLHMPPTFTHSSFRMHTGCGALICLLLAVAITSAGVNCYFMHTMYENDWCTETTRLTAKSEPVLGGSKPITFYRPPADLARDLRTQRLFLTHAMILKADAFAETATPATVKSKSVITVSAGSLFGGCNPFDGCISSFHDMGFTGAEGWTTTWAALAAAVTGLFAEMMVMIIVGRPSPEAGLGESAAALLQGEDERLL